ncbi:MAG: phosphate uptake regulator PhoU [Conexivisphaerales archaeon]
MKKAEGTVRKIQFTGRSSFSLNLPKSWVEEVGLKPQDSVVISEEGNSLIVTPLRSADVGGHQVDLLVDSSNVDRGIRKVISAYLAGCEIIRIIPSEGRLGLEYKDSLKDAISKRTIGFEVTEDSLKELTFQALVARPQVDIFSTVRRMFIISSNMLNDAVASLLHSDTEEAASVVKADDDVDRFNFYAIRALNQAVENPTLLKDTGLKYRSEAVTAKTILKSIERIADHAVAIASLAGKIPQLSSEDSEFLRRESTLVSKAFEESISSFLNLDMYAAETLLDENKRSDEDRLTAKIKLGPSAGLVLEHLHRVADYSSDICEAVIDIIVAREMKRKVSPG